MEELPTVNQAAVERVRREFAYLAEMTGNEEEMELSTRFGLTSEEIRRRLDELELSLVALETAVDRLQQTVIAQFEAEARRLISSLSSAGVLASYLALSNDCITGRSMDFFLLKVAVDLFGTEAPLAVLLRQIKPESDGQVESIIVQLTVPDHLQDRFPSAQQWFDEAVKRLLEIGGDQAPKLAIFPLKSRKVRRQVRYRVKLAEEEEGTNSSDSQRWKAAEEALRRALQEVVEKKKDE
ncbi:hypothetical protein TYRP_020318 [Tyrophagus putrescentiae]|nr:hypothetical protein TYRP_020318 [Tyrophagus putrescentiae]